MRIQPWRITRVWRGIMRRRFVAAAAIVFGLSSAHLSFALDSPHKAIVAYVFARDRVLGPNEVVATSLTRVNYAFSNIKDGKIVAGFAHDRENYQILHNLKKLNPKLEVLTSVGGWTWSGGFSDMALTPASRKVFIDSAVEFIRVNQLDGLDIDWEFPGSIGDGNKFRPEDKQNYTALLKELRSRFDSEEKVLGRHLVTSIAAGASEQWVRDTQMGEVQKYVDSVNLMAYDYYEPDSGSTTGHHTPLYSNPADPKHVSADSSVKLFEQAGVPADKLILGAAFYGHVWSDVGATNNGLYQPGKATKTETESDYHNIAANMLGHGYTRSWDSVASAPYLYNASTRTWVSYDDPESLALKCQYLVANHLEGIMFWDYTGDTPDHTLLNSINKALDAAPKTSGTGR